MSDQPQPRNDPEQPPSRIVEEPPLPDDWDDDPDEDQDNPVQAWNGEGWPGPELFWP